MEKSKWLLSNLSIENFLHWVLFSYLFELHCTNPVNFVFPKTLLQGQFFHVIIHEEKLSRKELSPRRIVPRRVVHGKIVFIKRIVLERSISWKNCPEKIFHIIKEKWIRILFSWAQYFPEHFVHEIILKNCPGEKFPRKVGHWKYIIIIKELSRKIVSGKICPGKICPGNFCPETIWLNLKK